MPADTPEPPLPNSYWVLPGTFLAGEHPGRGAATALESRERLRQLMDAGIDCFIDLTMPDELEPYESELPGGVQYLRRPIRDHGILAQREHMIEILDVLERSLRAGRRVYVHCRAGIGRTGMVAGCFLIERGAAGAQALDVLNELWRRCQKSRTWPRVPETEEQAAFVLNWQSSTVASPAAKSESMPTPAPASITARQPRARRAPAGRPPIAQNRSLRDRFHGALLGLAVGDALAAATQGLKPGSFEPIGNLIGGGPFELPAGAWSDDTAMALCLADSLLARNGFDVHDQVERYTLWQHEGYLSATGRCVGITPNTARAIAAAQWRRQVFAGSHDPRQLDPEVLSRIAPAVMFAFGSPRDALHIACDSARITCQAPLAVDACQLFAALVYAALADEPKERILPPAPELLDIDSLRPSVRKLVSTAIAGSKRPPHAGHTVLSVLAAALWAFRSTANFHDGALRAANLGGHSDVIAAVFGQLAGAHYGASGIPVVWRNALTQKALIAGFADQLFAHAQRQTIG